MMERIEVAGTIDPPGRAPKLAYTSPVLSLYGAVQEITGAGSGIHDEANGGHCTRTDFTTHVCTP
jgi:hypothetical protein